jgi:hypothetical protein
MNHKPLTEESMTMEKTEQPADPADEKSSYPVPENHYTAHERVRACLLHDICQEHGVPELFRELLMEGVPQLHAKEKIREIKARRINP